MSLTLGNQVFYNFTNANFNYFFFYNKTKTKRRCRNSSFPWCSNYITGVTAMARLWEKYLGLSFFLCFRILLPTSDALTLNKQGSSFYVIDWQIYSSPLVYWEYLFLHCSLNLKANAKDYIDSLTVIIGDLGILKKRWATSFRFVNIKYILKDRGRRVA